MNLVYERTDRIMVLEKVGSILADHPSFQGRQYCECEICRRATEVGRAARYSPRVARILAKGEGMTTNEYKYLLRKGLTRTEIKRETGVMLEQESSSIPLTVSRYEMLRGEGLVDREIAAMYRMALNALIDWKRVNGFIKVEIKGLDKRKYQSLKFQGLTDKKIMEKFNTYTNVLSVWKRQNFTDFELKMLNKKRGRKSYEKVDKG